MPDGYTVVPESLLSMVDALRDAHRDWTTMKDTLDSLALGTWSFGVLGEAAGYPDRYNIIKDEVVTKLADGGAVLDETSRTLEKVAKHYNEKDAEYYEQFGYLESDMD